ncbi:Ubiquitin carboxyl-terminal hydrolase MINDY-1, partial [Blyttiomyces sp. JEL0837]
NVLLLRGDISIHYDRSTVTYEHLVDLIGDYLFKRNPAGTPAVTPSASQEELYANLSHNLQDVMNVIPTLQAGLDVNVKFDSPYSFELTPALLVFDLFGITLCHGWTVDPQDQETWNVVVKSLGSYNRVVEAVINGDDAGNAITRHAGGKGKEVETDVDAQKKGLEMAKLEKMVHEGLVCQAFLHNTASQLTYHGLNSMVESLPPNSLGVLFRNNHFSTIFKHPEHGLYTLVTDQGFARTSGVVWETLSNVEGDSVFVDGLFREYEHRDADVHELAEEAGHINLDAIDLKAQEEAWERAKSGGGALPTMAEAAAVAAAADGGETYNDDLRLAMSLQEEEDRIARQEDQRGQQSRGGNRQQQQQPRVQQRQPTSPQQQKKNKDGCIIS